jgi:hypothetical protein
MGFLDKLLGRAKQVAEDVTDEVSDRAKGMRREGDTSAEGRTEGDEGAAQMAGDETAEREPGRP